MIRYTKRALLIIVDILIVNFSYIMAFLLRFDFEVSSDLFTMSFSNYGSNLFAISVINIVTFAIFGLYTGRWRYIDTMDLAKIFSAAITASLLLGLYMGIIGQSMSKSIYFISCMVLIITISLVRLIYSAIRSLKNPEAMVTKSHDNDSISKVMVVGAGTAAAALIAEMKYHPEYRKKVALAIDDDAEKQGARIQGVKILGDRTRIKLLARKYAINEIVIAIPSLPKQQLKILLEECNKTNCKIKILSDIADNKNASIFDLRNADIEDLIGGEPMKFNTRDILGYVQGKIVLVTGAGGLIGAEICRQVCKYKPRRLIILDTSETSLLELGSQLQLICSNLEIEIVIASVCDKEAIDAVFERFNPHIIFHAAGYENTALMENNLGEALLNNVLGTKNLLDLSERYVVGKFIMISSNKVMNPNNVVGATKKICEMMLKERSRNSQINYCAVRIGSIIESNESIVNIFKRQIEIGGPITIANPETTKLLISKKEAVQLVLQAGAIGEGGEIFKLEMGEPINLLKLAKNMIKLSGQIPNRDIEIKLEEAYEKENLKDVDTTERSEIKMTSCEKIYIVNQNSEQDELERLDTMKYESLETEISEISLQNSDKIKAWISKVVPDYII